ncbi:MAG: hypothetical protein WCE79_03210 [Xanthobacteraceae bacterium]
MTPNHLRRFIDQCTASQLALWVKKQTLVARTHRNFLARRFGSQDLSNSTPIGLPDEDAIVNEAIERVLGEGVGFVWDGVGDFDTFFRRCIIKSMEILRGEERKYRSRALKTEVVALNFLPAQLSAHEVHNKFAADIARRPDVYKRALATAIVENRMGVTMKNYMERLPTYSELKMTTAEIAEDLGVKPGSVDPYRQRLRGLIKDQDGD